ncbi:MAG: hypothetical protein JJU45_06880 [Acidimicrobiia bacterium]|nr:hypothetical protein [Acidimicrobiia bacterium]
MTDADADAAMPRQSSGGAEWHERDDLAPTSELDDVADRGELRQRYYGLLQELRVVLPGVQVLLAFLLTVPFAPGFADLDDLGRDLYGVALVATALAVTLLMAPIALHRFGARRQRRARLLWAVGITRVGLVLLAVAVVGTVLAVTRFVFGASSAVLASGAVTTVLILTWIVLPQWLRWGDRRTSG